MYNQKDDMPLIEEFELFFYHYDYNLDMLIKEKDDNIKEMKDRIMTINSIKFIKYSKLGLKIDESRSEKLKSLLKLNNIYGKLYGMKNLISLLFLTLLNNLIVMCFEDNEFLIDDYNDFEEIMKIFSKYLDYYIENLNDNIYDEYNIINFITNESTNKSIITMIGDIIKKEINKEGPIWY